MAKKIISDLDLNQNEIQNAVVQNLTSAPSNPVAGQAYYNTSDNIGYIYNGTSWIALSGGSLSPATLTTLGTVKLSDFIGLDSNNQLNPNVHVYDWDGNSSTTTPSNIALFQKIWDDYLAGNRVAVITNKDDKSLLLFVSSLWSTTITLASDVFTASSMTISDAKTMPTQGYYAANITKSEDTITNVSAVFLSFGGAGYYVLDTNTDYTTPYTPLYNGSPATKKYVDDGLLTKITEPTSEGTSGQVLTTNGSGGRTWTTVSGGGGGDVVGPSSSINNNVVMFNGTTGKIIKDSGLSLSGINTGDQSASDFDIKDLTDSTSLRATWSGKQDALGYTAENIANKKLDLTDNSDVYYPSQKAVKTAVDAKVSSNTAITGSTKTKITYDSKGLVTGGADATTADIADSTDKRYVTDAQKTVISNTSGTNTGDETTSTIKTKLGASTSSSDGYATSTQITKLDGIETGAEVNNISDVNATDLTDGGATTLHKHSYTNLDDTPTIPTITLNGMATTTPTIFAPTTGGYVGYIIAGNGTGNAPYWSSLKTINSNSILGTGNLEILGGVTSVNTVTGDVVLDADDIDDTSTTHKFVTDTDITKLSNLSGINTGDQDLSGKQDLLISGTNIKTVNNESLLGSGNIVIEGSTRATQAEAEAGVNNENYMTPLRVAQLLATLWTNNIVFIVSDTQPSPIVGKTIVWVDSSEF